MFGIRVLHHATQPAVSFHWDYLLHTFYEPGVVLGTFRKLSLSFSFIHSFVHSISREHPPSERTIAFQGREKCFFSEHPQEFLDRPADRTVKEGRGGEGPLPRGLYAVGPATVACFSASSLATLHSRFYSP